MKRLIVLAMAALAAFAACKDATGPKPIQVSFSISVAPETALVSLTANQPVMWLIAYGKLGYTDTVRSTSPSTTFGPTLHGLEPGTNYLCTATATAQGVSVSIDCGFSTPAVSLTITPASPTVQVGDSIRLSASFSPPLANPSVVWTTTMGSIDSSGLVSNLMTAGTATVKACSQAYPRICGTTTVTITTHDLIAFWRMEDTLTKSRCYGAPCQELYLMRRNGTDTSRLTNTPWYWDGQPKWSWDGRKLAFARAQMGTQQNPGVLDIFIINRDGSGLRNVTQGQVNRISSQMPAFSPDGRRLVFSYYDVGTGHDSAGIAVIDTMSGNLKKLTANPCYTGCVLEGDPSFLPDGSRITFTGQDGKLWQMDTLGANKARLNQPLALNGQAVWSSDGQHLFFTSNLTGTWQIYVMNPDGSNARQITQEPVGAIDPTVSRDGREIDYTCMGTEVIQFPGNGGTTVNWDICSINVDGTGRANLTQTPNLVERWPARQP